VEGGPPSISVQLPCPYGIERHWDWSRYKTLLPTTRSKEQFRESYKYAIILSVPDHETDRVSRNSFDDDNAHVATCTP
jgi:hypothetical protein